MICANKFFMNKKLAVALAIVFLAGCATSEKPNYQGHKGTSPTVHDYYPPKTNSTPNR